MGHMYQKQDNLEYEIILVLLKRNLHLREVSRQLKKPPSTIQRKLGDLVYKKILDFKVQGRNKLFFIKKNIQSKNYVYNVERYKLIKLVNTYPELGIIINEILKKNKENLIILFGSYTKFSSGKSSDIDIYVNTKNRKVKESLELINSKISVKIGIFDLNSYLIKEIIKDHIILRGVEGFYERIKFFE